MEVVCWASEVLQNRNKPIELLSAPRSVCAILKKKKKTRMTSRVELQVERQRPAELSSTEASKAATGIEGTATGPEDGALNHKGL